MYVRFHIDPETGLPHIYNHGVDEDEVEEVLEKPDEVLRGGRGSRIAYGRTFGGRYLKVVYTEDPEPYQVFVVTAYDLRGNELRAHRRRMRRRR